MLIVMLLFRQFSSNSSSSYSSVSVVFLYCIHLYSQKDCRSTPIMAYIPTICCFWGIEKHVCCTSGYKMSKREKIPLILSHSLFQLDPLFAGRWLFGVGTKTFCFKKRQQRLLYLGAYYLLYSGVIVLGNKMCLAQALNNKKVLYAIKRHSSFVDSLQIVRQSCLLDRICQNKFL